MTWSILYDMQHSANYSEKSKNYAVILCNFHIGMAGRFGSVRHAVKFL